MKVDIDKMWYTYSLMLIWLLIMFGLAGLLFFVGIGEISTYLTLLLLNLFLRIGSYVFDYKDGKEIFQFGSCLILLIILGTILFTFGFSVFRHSLFLWTRFSLGFIAFLVFIVRIVYSVEKKFAYLLFLLGMLAIGMFFLSYFSDFSWATVICLILFSLICMVILYVKKRKPRKPTSLTISVRRILAGERIFKRESLTLWKQQVFYYFQDAPKRFAPLLEAINLCLLGVLVFSYFSSILSTAFVSLDLFYRIGLVIFLLNIFLLKKLSYVSNVSRFSLAFVINFGFYSALLQF
ncbi:MAG: hypothetical protein LBI53_01895 [Candidatus Peribacteria bacterium]|nr:hypothetical protein [Candidatus Peribacteria bacterium]